MAGESGSNLKEPDKAPPSALPSPEEKTFPEAGSRKLTVVLAEDNPGDVLLVVDSMAQHGLDVELRVERDGEKMMTLVERMAAGEMQCPDLILLDLNLPKQNGQVLLGRIRQCPLCADIPVIVVTSSEASRDREIATRLGATEYFCKPSEYDDFMKLGEVVRRVIAGRQRLQ